MRSHCSDVYCCMLPCCARRCSCLHSGIFSFCLGYHALFTHRHDCLMKTAWDIEYLLSRRVRVVLEHCVGAALTGCRSRCWRRHGWNNDHLKLSPDSSASTGYKRTPMQPNLRFQTRLSNPSCILKSNFIAYFRLQQSAIWLGNLCIFQMTKISSMFRYA